jgi:hypothetical protein
MLPSGLSRRLNLGTRCFASRALAGARTDDLLSADVVALSQKV